MAKVKPPAEHFTAASEALRMGKGGEDGLFRGPLEWMALPYTHSGAVASAVGLGKDLSRPWSRWRRAIRSPRPGAELFAILIRHPLLKPRT